MTSHQLAQALLALPDKLVTDDNGFEIGSANEAEAIVYRAGLENVAAGILGFQGPETSDYVYEIEANMPRLNVIRLRLLKTYEPE